MDDRIRVLGTRIKNQTNTPPEVESARVAQSRVLKDLISEVAISRAYLKELLESEIFENTHKNIIITELETLASSLRAQSFFEKHLNKK